MQTLGLATSTPKTESRLKTLLWPSVRSQGDVELLTHQGFWVCTVVAAGTLVFAFFQRAIVLELLSSAYFFLGGIGVRCRSRIAAVCVLLAYLLSTAAVLRFLATPGGIIRLVFLALLLANARAIWLSAKLPPAPKSYEDQVAAGADFSDRFPKLVWPKLQWVFYVWSIPWIAANLFGAIYLLILHQ